MFSLQSILNLSVLEASTGKRVGRVRDVWLNEHWLLKGIVLEGKGYLSRRLHVLPWQHVVACGADAVLVSAGHAIEQLPPGEIARCFQSGRSQLRNLPVVTSDGQQLGRIADVYFYRQMGNMIIACELTDGFIADLREGRRWLRISDYPDEVVFGEASLIVPVRAEQDLVGKADLESVSRENG